MKASDEKEKVGKQNTFRNVALRIPNGHLPPSLEVNDFVDISLEVKNNLDEIHKCHNKENDFFVKNIKILIKL